MEEYTLAIEKAVLSAIFFNPDNFEEVASVLNSGDFLHVPHGLIFGALSDLVNQDLPVDETFVAKKLTGQKAFSEQDLVEVISTNPVIDLRAYVKELKNRSIKRRLNKLASTIRDFTDNSGMESEEIVDSIEQELYKINQDSEDKEFRYSEEITAATLEKIEEMKARGNTMLTGMDTGFYDLNRKTTGFGEGDLIIIAARPSMGKTAFALNIVQKALDNQLGVAFFSLEMPAEQLMLRMLSAKTSLPLQNLRVGNLQDDEWSQLSGACDMMSKKSLFVDDDGVLTINQMRAKLRKLKSKHPEIGLAVIDYLQLMQGTGGKDRHLEVSEISRSLKLLARELQIPIIALSQLNRGLEARADKRPMLSDLRESGAIEQDADIILFVYREAVYRLKEEKEKEEEARKEGKEFKRSFFEKNEEEAEIIIGKQRNGPTGIVEMVFQKHCTRFMDKSREVEVVFQKTNLDTHETKIDHAPI